MRVLLSRRDTLRLLILSELVMNKNCNQRDIAAKLNLTPQAISEHFKDLISDGYVRVLHKGFYEVTEKGYDWLSKNLFDLHMFSEDLVNRIYSRSIVAIAEGDIDVEDSVKYWFEDGYIFATRSEEGNGIAMTAAKHGEDVLVKAVGGFEPPRKGEVIVVKVPDVGEGGSRKVNLEEFRKLVNARQRSIVVALGVEALVTCRKIGIEPIYFGSKNVCIEAAHQGSGVIAACTETLLDDLLRSLIDEGIRFEVKDFHLDT